MAEPVSEPVRIYAAIRLHVNPGGRIVSDQWVFIDRDGAGPGSRLRDLADAIKGFVPLADRGDPLAAPGGGSGLESL